MEKNLADNCGHYAKEEEGDSQVSVLIADLLHIAAVLVFILKRCITPIYIYIRLPDCGGTEQRAGLINLRKL